jgi:hypothetical protein
MSQYEVDDKVQVTSRDVPGCPFLFGEVGTVLLPDDGDGYVRVNISWGGHFRLLPKEISPASPAKRFVVFHYGTYSGGGWNDHYGSFDTLLLKPRRRPPSWGA